MDSIQFQDKVSFIWANADLLRGDYKQSEYGKVILPLTVIRRIDAVLEPTKEAVLSQLEELKAMGMTIEDGDFLLQQAAEQPFYNTSNFTLKKLLDDPQHIEDNFRDYLFGFSQNVRDIIEHFDFDKQISRLAKANLLYLLIQNFANFDLHPDRVSNVEMGYIFEELIRRFSEQSNETAGEHFTPREVIKLMVNLLFINGTDELTKPGVIRSIYDPACGTGGMLSVASEYIRKLNERAELITFGQELNPESYAICKADMLLKNDNPQNIKLGNSFSEDQLANEKFDYMLSNPPFGVDWKKVQDVIKAEHETLGFEGRFGAGLPRVSDGSLLFLQHMISKMKPAHEGGSRIAIVFNGSPLFTGGAGSGESEIRKWIIENDLLEAIVALPDQLFYNTGISTYIWVLTNKKEEKRKGKIQLIQATHLFQKMRKPLGEKRNELLDEHIDEITRLYGDFTEGKYVKIFDNEDFGYRRITVERPLKLKITVTKEKLAALEEESAFSNLAKSKKKGEAAKAEIEEGERLQQQIKTLLLSFEGQIFMSRDTFLKQLKKAAQEQDIKLSTAIVKAIISVFGEHDEDAEPYKDNKGNLEPNPELRDYENVPLKEDIEQYFEREVKPFVPDAWIDHEKTVVGYEIPFTRTFYEFSKVEPPEKIAGEIKELHKEIQKLMGELFI
ncbi:type I restriction modification system, N-6 DNA methylase subunit [Anoxybacillus flavithermus TNO-09.006]|uniref:site-specific DNA-methyltransferase (adenine-specific) n=1 Tax=Anoxybacillus flavithermus TaxID=33934 RepID=A0AAX2A1B5_9BACL|nr:class I SAM-dependent DNA methyltransferase [Anoxybacillus flavithermus]ELK22560.1 type I restriction modification system, N-6 DNA methylase subunit [Anoxybacillus flavithermus TNO-09.006]RWU13370.1 SAM-dependent DNA methyltransferase [Anoxybacillus flavithermus]